MPITWQNVNAPSLGDPNRSMQGASQSMADAFAPLREQLKDYRTNQDQNWQVGKDNNTDAFLSTLNSRYKTPEALAAAQQSGELDALRSSFGAQIDMSKVRDAEDNRGSVLQQRGIARIQYENQAADERLRPMLNAAGTFAAEGNMVGLRGYLSTQPELLARYGAKLISEGVAGDEARRKFADGLLTSQNQRENADKQSVSQRISANASATGAGAQVMQANTAAGQLQLQGQQAKRLNDQQDREMGAAQNRARLDNLLKGNAYRDGVYTPDKAPVLMDLMTKAGIGDDLGERQAVIKRIQELADKQMPVTFKDANGVTQTQKLPIPMAKVVESILGSKEQMINWWNQGYANSTENDLKKSLQAPNADGVGNRSLDDYLAWQAITAKSAENVPSPVRIGGGNPAAANVDQKKTPYKPESLLKESLPKPTRNSR